VQSGADYTLVRLEKVEAGTVEAADKERLAQQLAGAWGQAENEALVRMLRGLTPVFGRLDGEPFEEARVEQHLAASPDLALAECWYWTRKLQARYLCGDYVTAMAAAARARALLWTS
ncbi:hypothetical protein, partial [Burkholderia sp. SIMBA_019]|uniref:hypothetical protein n=1 Tax=Burkholderia sp. SIMBA_019 TaxID=3085765 RepID=UPI00397B6924